MFIKESKENFINVDMIEWSKNNTVDQTSTPNPQYCTSNKMCSFFTMS